MYTEAVRERSESSNVRCFKFRHHPRESSVILFRLLVPRSTSKMYRIFVMHQPLYVTLVADSVSVHAIQPDPGMLLCTTTAKRLAFLEANVQ